MSDLIGLVKNAIAYDEHQIGILKMHIDLMKLWTDWGENLVSFLREYKAVQDKPDRVVISVDRIRKALVNTKAIKHRHLVEHQYEELRGLAFKRQFARFTAGQTYIEFAKPIISTNCITDFSHDDVRIIDHEVGDMANGMDIGCSPGNYIWASCPNCGKQEWCKLTKNGVKYTRGCWVKFTHCTEYLKRLYSYCNENLRMPDFPLRQFNNYQVRLRPNDWFRSAFDDINFPVLNYFNSSEMYFDLRLAVPNIKENKNLNDLVKYEWQLFTESDKPVARASDPQFQFYNVAGNGDLEMVTTKPKRAERRGSEYHQYGNDDWIMRLKSQAVKIGEYSKLGHYKVVMRFADKSGNWSGWMPMAHFTIVDKDKMRQTLLIGILSALVVLVGTIILHAFGLA